MILPKHFQLKVVVSAVILLRDFQLKVVVNAGILPRDLQSKVVVCAGIVPKELSQRHGKSTRREKNVKPDVIEATYHLESFA